MKIPAHIKIAAVVILTLSGYGQAEQAPAPVAPSVYKLMEMKRSMEAQNIICAIGIGVSDIEMIANNISSDRARAQIAEYIRETKKADNDSASRPAYVLVQGAEVHETVTQYDKKTGLYTIYSLVALAPKKREVIPQSQSTLSAEQKTIAVIDSLGNVYTELFKKGDAAGAAAVLQHMMANYPRNPHAWWVSIAMSTNNFTTMMAHKSSLDTILGMIKNNTAPAEFAKYKKEYDAFIERMEQKLDEGLIKAAKGGEIDWEIEALKSTLGRTKPRKKR